MSLEDQLADTYKPAPHAAIYNQQGGRYHRNSKFTQDHSTQDASVSIKVDDVEMYGLFCGFKDGGWLANFAMNRMVYELFTEDPPIISSMTPPKVIELLRDKFINMDSRCFREVEGDLTEIYLSKEGYPRDDARISELENKIRAGCTALVVLRIHDDLYVLNCGTSQALVFTDNQQVVRLIEAVHDNENPEEIARLRAIDVDPNDVSAPTRALGDNFRRQKYEEDPAFKNAKGPPVIAEPEVFHCTIQIGWRHLLLVSGGIVQNLKDCEVDDVPMEIYEQFKEFPTLQATASTLVFTVERKHKDAYDKHVQNNPLLIPSNHREEMSVIYVKLHDNPSIISTIDSSINSTTGSINTEPETIEPYVDLSPSRTPKSLEKFLVIR